MKKSELHKLIKEEIRRVLKEAGYVPGNVRDYAKNRGIESLVKKVATWAEKAGKRVVGGVAIGKNYGTLVLDLTYQGGEVRIDIDNEEVTLNGKSVVDARSFKKALESMTENLSEVSNKFTEGDKVKVITPSMSHSGKTGIIVDIAPSGSFYLVKFSSNQNAYFHESDLRIVKSPIA
jgi:ribosomal protein L21E